VSEDAPNGQEPSELVVTNDLSELTRVSAWVHAWSQQHGMTDRTVERLDLCSTEAVTNIIMHGYADSAAHEIALRLDCRHDSLALEIQDDGGAFDPRQVNDPQPAATLEDAQVGGWGVQMIRRFSDGWHYGRSGDRNHLTIVFRLSHPCHGGQPRHHVVE